MRKTPLVENEYYHIFNRGVDKRTVFLCEDDFQRFLKSMVEFNVIKPIGSIYENSFVKQSQQLGHSMSKLRKNRPLIEFIAYCLNPNHYHFIVRQTAERGIERFMKRIGNGYTKYFNERHKRSGVLFQGGFKSVHVESNEQLLHLSIYVNLNYKVHRLGHGMSKSSWEEYVGIPTVRLCNASLLKTQFGNMKEYEKTARETIGVIRERRDMEELLLE